MSSPRSAVDDELAEESSGKEEKERIEDVHTYTHTHAQTNSFSAT